MSLKSSSALVGIALVAWLVWLAVAHREDGAQTASETDAPATRPASVAVSPAPNEPEASTPAPERSALSPAPADTESSSSASDTPCRLRVLDAGAHVLTDARVITLDDEQEYRAGTDGLVVVPLPDDRRSDALVWAPGHEARRGVELSRGRRDVVLVHDPGLRVSVVWADDDTPVVGALVSVQPDERFGKPMTRVWQSLPGAQATTDARGETTLFGVRCGRDKAAVDVEYAQGPRVTVPARALRDPQDELGIVRELRVAYPRAADELELVVRAPAELVQRLHVELRVLDGVYELERSGDDRFRLAGVSLRSMRATSTMNVRLSAHVADGPNVLLEELRDPLETSLAQLRAREYTVDALALRVHVSGAFEAGRYEVTSAVARKTEHAELFGAWPAQTDLVWQAVPANGDLELTQGWRGSRTCALLRLASTGEIVDAALVTPDVATELRGPALGTLHLDIEAAMEIAGARLVCNPQEGREPSRITRQLLPTPLKRGRNTLELPHGAYGVWVAWRGTTWNLGDVTLSSEPVVRTLTLPALRVVRGRALGSASSHADFYVYARTNALGVSSQTSMDVDGRFELRVPAEQDAVVTLGWDCTNRAWIPCGMQVQVSRTQDFVEIERPEVLLRFVERESAEFAGFHSWNVRADPDAPSETLNPDFHRDFGREGSVEAALPPGTYVVQERAGAEVLGDTRVTLARGESHTFEGTLSRSAFVSLVAARSAGELIATATRTDGPEKLVFASNGIPTADVRKRMRGFVLAPGRYEVVVKPPNAAQKPWTRDVRVVEGDRLTFEVEF